MKKIIDAYRKVSAADEFKEIERLRERARFNEASALRHARLEGEKAEREKWEKVVAELRARLGEDS